MAERGRIQALLATRETGRLLQNDQVVELEASLVSELARRGCLLPDSGVEVGRDSESGEPHPQSAELQGEPGARKLLDAIEHFKENDGAVDMAAPVAFLDAEEKAKVTQDGRFRVSLYKALFFLHLQSRIKSGALNLEHSSYKYRPLDDCLINRARWCR